MSTRARRPTWTLGALALLAACAPTRDRPGERPVADVTAARVDALFAPWSRDDSPGFAVGVVRDGALVHAAGYGRADLEQGVPLTPRSVLYVGSVAKQFTAFAMLLLERDGRLSLDDDIRTHLPEMPAYERPVTVDQLLHHTSGIRDFFTLAFLRGARPEDFLSPEEILDLIRRQRATSFPPGERFSYCNSGYWLLARIVERVSGETFADFTARRIFRPLGMDRSRFVDDAQNLIAGRARGHVRRPDGGFALRERSYTHVGPGGLFATVEDLVRWDRNFFEPTVGDRALLDRLLAPGTTPDGRSTGEGAGLVPDVHRGHAVVHHSGNAPGHAAEILRFPEDRLTVIVLGNLRDADADPTRLAFAVADLYLAEHAPLAPESAVPDPPIRAPESAPSSWDRFAGRYRRAETGIVFEIGARGGRPTATFMSRDGWGVFDLVPESGGSLRVDGFPGAPRRIVLREADSAGPRRLEFHTEGRDAPTVYPALAPLEAAGAAPFLGRYRSEELDAVYDVVLEDGGLVVGLPAQAGRRLFPEPLVPLQPNAFTDGARTILVFDRSDDGAASGITVNDPRAEGLRFERVRGG